MEVNIPKLCSTFFLITINIHICICVLCLESVGFFSSGCKSKFKKKGKQ